MLTAWKHDQFSFYSGYWPAPALWQRKLTSGLMKTGLKSGGKGGAGEINYVSSANPELRLLDFDEDYDFNLPPPSMKKGPVPVNVSINLRNILQVKICVQPFYDGLFLSMFHLDWKTEKNVGSLAGKNGQSVFFLGWIFFFRFDSKSRFPFASCEGCKVFSNGKSHECDQDKTRKVREWEPL